MIVADRGNQLRRSSREPFVLKAKSTANTGQVALPILGEAGRFRIRWK